MTIDDVLRTDEIVIKRIARYYPYGVQPAGMVSGNPVEWVRKTCGLGLVEAFRKRDAQTAKGTYYNNLFYAWPFSEEDIEKAGWTYLNRTFYFKNDMHAVEFKLLFG